jgi:hypothetical protein
MGNQFTTNYRGIFNNNHKRIQQKINNFNIKNFPVVNHSTTNSFANLHPARGGVALLPRLATRRQLAAPLVWWFGLQSASSSWLVVSVL